jgi:hypothetical protein
VEYRLQQVWQAMDGSFAPLGVEIPHGLYTYTRHRFKFSWDLSAPVGGVLRYATGEFFDGTLNTLTAELRLAPLPNVEITGNYELNQIRGLGKQRDSMTAGVVSASNFDTHLLGVNARVALNPQTQIIGFAQWNSAARRTVWNVRLAWEYQPLSFLYLVFNSNEAPFTTATGIAERRITQQGIAKLTFVRQL